MSKLLHIETYLPASWTQSPAEIDQEIGDELAFHLEMRTAENLRQGMSPSEARSDAERHFGNYAATQQACRDIQLGPQRMLQRIQLALLAALLAAVVYQATVLSRVETRHRDQIDALTDTIAQLEATLAPPPTVAATMPLQKWELAMPRIADADNARNLDHWQAEGDPMAAAWTDWQVLAMPAAAEAE